MDVNWIRVTKAVASVVIIGGLVLIAVFYPHELMRNKYAVPWSALTVYAIWTRKRHLIVKAIASIGPAIMVLASIMLLLGFPQKWYQTFFLGVVPGMILTAIWLRFPYVDKSVPQLPVGYRPTPRA